jgi:hypothetical protein
MVGIWWLVRQTVYGSAQGEGAVWLGVGLGVGSSVLSVLLLELLMLFRRSWEDLRRQRRFRKFFGIPEIDGRVAVVVSAFAGTQQMVWDKQVVGWPSYGDAAPPNPNARVDMSVRSDLICAASIMSAFAEVDLSVPTMVWDDEAIKHLESGEGVYNVMIIVGLFTNNFVGWLREKRLLRLFDLDYDTNWTGKKSNEMYGHIAIAHHEDRRLTHRETWAVLRGIDQVLDRGIVAKMQLGKAHGNVMVFIIGGISETGTEESGKFVRTHWRALMNWRDQDNNQRVGDREFALVVDVPFGQRKESPSVNRVCVENQCSY